jgi:nucleoside-triphosphatase
MTLRTLGNILLTGLPGIGKTTIIQKVVRDLTRPAGGFYTREIREGSTRKGFRIISLDGREGLLAHRDFTGPFRVGRYGVNVADIERIAVNALEQALENSGCLIIDEIGRMELFSQRFQRCVLQCLDASTTVLGTIQRARTPFLDRIRSREDVEIITVTTTNRNDLPSNILRMLDDAPG